MAMELLMGNQAIAYGAIRAGVGLVSGYPGTPSTEVLETVAALNRGDIYVEWSVNEKAALEVAAGAAYAGLRSMVTMKQVGLNACCDPVMSLAYLGVKGGMVLVVADDPGPISSQTEQDTRKFAAYAKIPVFDPSSPGEAYEMVQDAFAYSEKYGTPVILRPTTRVCHACESIQVSLEHQVKKAEGFVKDARWVVFPALSRQCHEKVEERRPVLAGDFAGYRFNRMEGSGRKGILTSGVSYAYVKEALAMLEREGKLPAGARESVCLCRIATAYPFPERIGRALLEQADTVLAIEELEPVLEENILMLAGKYGIAAQVSGRLDGTVPVAGENSAGRTKALLERYLLGNAEERAEAARTAGAAQAGAAQGQMDGSQTKEEPPALPVRPPVLCAGCPHRASFYAVKEAMQGKKAVFSGDIGCYTLGNAAPLHMVDTCLCMGAGVTIPQGIRRAEPDTYSFGFVGDSTFFHTGIPGVINAVYNQTKMTLIVLDNSTTAMTGQQPHPGTGVTMMGEMSRKVSIRKVLEGIGVSYVAEVDPFDFERAVETVKEAASQEGVSAVIFEAPCIAVSKPKPAYRIDGEKCIKCSKCMTKLGCPAISRQDGKVVIDGALCYGCGLCTYVCPTDAIRR